MSSTVRLFTINYYKIFASTSSLWLTQRRRDSFLNRIEKSIVVRYASDSRESRLSRRSSLKARDKSSISKRFKFLAFGFESAFALSFENFLPPNKNLFEGRTRLNRYSRDRRCPESTLCLSTFVRDFFFFSNISSHIFNFFLFFSFELSVRFRKRIRQNEVSY